MQIGLAGHIRPLHNQWYGFPNAAESNFLPIQCGKFTRGALCARPWLATSKKFDNNNVIKTTHVVFESQP